MPRYVKMDVYQVTARRNGAIHSARRVAYHWFYKDDAPIPFSQVSNSLIAQNGLPEGDYYYAATLWSVLESRIPAGGLYR